MNFTTTFSGKRVFLTGHTGFKGSWLALWLARLGARVYGYALPPPTEPSNFVLSGVEKLVVGHTLADIRDARALTAALDAAQPDLIFHLAAQPLVRLSYEQPQETFDVNVMGTACLLDAVRGLRRPCAVVVVTSDKCYENVGHERGYCESDPMGGFDPYSASKGATELLVASYRRSFFHPERLAEHGVRLATARAGNVIGGGDWARDRIVTDMVASLVAGTPIPVRNPHAVRPWQHVLEPLSGYLTLAAALLDANSVAPGLQPEVAGSSPIPHRSGDAPATFCAGWNFGPVCGGEFTVGELAGAFVQAWGGGSWQDVSQPGQPHEAAILRLNIDQAGRELGWHPRWDCAETVARTARWYRRVLLEQADAHAECVADIEAYAPQK